jgi:hypothetical protein
VGDIGLSGGGKTETKPSGQTKIVIREGELRPRGNSGEPVGGSSLPEAEEVRREGRRDTNRAGKRAGKRILYRSRYGALQSSRALPCSRRKE